MCLMNMSALIYQDLPVFNQASVLTGLERLYEYLLFSIASSGMHVYLVSHLFCANDIYGWKGLY